MVPKINQVNFPLSHQNIMFQEFNEVVYVPSIIEMKSEGKQYTTNLGKQLAKVENLVSWGRKALFLESHCKGKMAFF